jgi:hypothetical protein
MGARRAILVASACNARAIGPRMSSFGAAAGDGEAWVSDVRFALPGTLLLSANVPVSSGALAEAVWDGSPLPGRRQRWAATSGGCSRSRISRRRAPIIRPQIAFALGACGGLATTRIPAAVKTASKDSVKGPASEIYGSHAYLRRFARQTCTIHALAVLKTAKGDVLAWDMASASRSFGASVNLC